VRLLYEFKWLWQSINVQSFIVILLLRVELQLEVDQLVEAHRYPCLIVFYHVEDVLEGVGVASAHSERYLRLIQGWQAFCPSEMHSSRGLHIAVEVILESHLDLSILLMDYVLIGILDV